MTEERDKDTVILPPQGEKEGLEQELLLKTTSEEKKTGTKLNMAIAGVVMMLLCAGGFPAMMRRHQTLLKSKNLSVEEATKFFDKLLLDLEDQDSEDAKPELAKTVPPGTPSPERRAAAKAFLLKNKLSSINLLEQEQSPQGLACDHLASLNLEYPAAGDHDGIYHVTTRYVLALLYFATGPWELKLKFLTDTDPCNWYNVLRLEDLTTDYKGVACSEDGKVKGLFLENNTMTGQLPSELALLTTLWALDLNFNSLSGTIPESLQAMTNLQNFFAMNSELTGSVPLFPSSICTINLVNNSLTGRLDRWNGANMTELVGVALDFNQMTGEIPAFTPEDFPKLTQVFLSHNQFVGGLGEGMLSIDALTHVDLSHNMLEGSIPSHLFALPSLKVLDLNTNGLTELQLSSHQNTALELLTLQNNFLHDHLPSNIGNLKALKHLDLSFNDLYGSVPSSFAKLTQLEQLFLAENEFDPGRQDGLGAGLEEWLPKLTNLKEVSLKSAYAKGPIPDLSGLTNLALLDLDNNQLTSTIPSYLGTLSNLRCLLLNRNQLTGEIPSSVLELPNIELFFSEYNAALNERPICDSVIASKGAMLAGQCSSCPCCDICCTQGKSCNVNTVVPNFDPVWCQSVSFVRQEFSFGPTANFITKV